MQDKLKAIFAGRQKKSVANSSRMPSAVLVPLLCKDEEVHILLTKRSQKVMHHKGEISFPGGAYGEPDRDLRETAMRESWEEIGLKPRDVEIIGDLDETETWTSNYVIKPFVGLIPYPYDFTPNPREIAQILIVPLSDLLKRKGDDGEEYYLEDVYSYNYRGNVIWGATATILRQLLFLLESCCRAQQNKC